MNKKWLYVVLAVALLLGAAFAALEGKHKEPDGQNTPGTQTASLPQAGEVINGFEVLEIRDFPMINASVVRFEHQKTGAQLYYNLRTPEKLAEWAEMLKVLAEEGAIRTAGGAAAIKDEAERYDKILDPFSQE